MPIDPQSTPVSPRAASDGDVADTTLLERIRQGDRQALHELYRKYYQPLLRFTHRITGRLELAEETVNDVMLVVWQDAAAFEGRSKVGTWVMGIAYRKAIKLAQRNRLWRNRFAAGDFDTAVERPDRVEELTDRAELEDLLAHALRGLPPEQRAVVELTYFFGCSYEEIASIVHCPVNTVKTRMFHARGKLRALLPMLGKDELR
jgi:RNA polymerase sigma-70 factor (ECF subfamily)